MNDTKANTAVLDATEVSIENAIKRGEATPGAFPYHDEWQRADAAAKRLTHAAEPYIVRRTRPTCDGDDDGPGRGYISQRERLQNREALDHAEQRSRQRVISNTSANGGRL